MLTNRVAFGRFEFFVYCCYFFFHFWASTMHAYHLLKLRSKIHFYRFHIVNINLMNGYYITIERCFSMMDFCLASLNFLLLYFVALFWLFCWSAVAFCADHGTKRNKKKSKEKIERINEGKRVKTKEKSAHIAHTYSDKWI